MRNLIAPVVVLSIVFFFIPSLQAAVITIDDFNESWTLDPPAIDVAVTKSETGLVDVYGGTRDTEYTVHGASTNGAGLELAESLFINSGGKRNWSVVVLTYDADGTGLNLDASAYTSILMDVWFEHVGKEKDTVFSVTLSDGVTSATVEKTWLMDSVSAEKFNLTLEFSLSDFTGVDLSNIQTITVYMESDWYGEYEVDRLYIPEPATIIILMFGSYVVFMNRKRRLTN